MLGKLKQSERHSVSGPGSRRCRGRKGRSPRRVRPSNWAEAPEASLGRSGCAGGRARPGEEAPWGRLKGAERGSGCRAEGPRAVCGQVDGTRRAAVRGHRGAQGVGSCRETGARRSLAERQVRRARRVGKAGLQPGVEVRGLPASLGNTDGRWGAAPIRSWTSPEPSCRNPGAPHGSTRSPAENPGGLHQHPRAPGRRLESSFHVHRYACEHRRGRSECTRRNGPRGPHAVFFFGQSCLLRGADVPFRYCIVPRASRPLKTPSVANNRGLGWESGEWVLVYRLCKPVQVPYTGCMP